jgi:ADP-heptose:LPS heptosyltransferase
LSASISCKEALAAIRRGERLPAALVRQLGEEQPADFFRIIIEGLADSFDPADATAYEDLMTAWIPRTPRVHPVIPDRVDTVYVLSRVTLGADIKISSTVLAAIKERFRGVDIFFVANRKSAELFASDASISHLEGNYPRSGPVSERIEFAHELRRRVQGPHRIVVDPDSRMTQLGLVPVCEPEHYFHFPSRTTDSAANLSQLMRDWLQKAFGEPGEAYIAPPRILETADSPIAAVSLGVGENDSKRIGGDFEMRLIRKLGEKFRTIWIDRGVGGEEAARVTAAAHASGCGERIRFWEGSFAGFTSLIGQSTFYTGYDSAGQHAAAALGVPVVTFFAGAPSSRFRERWSPAGRGRVDVIDASVMPPDACLEHFSALLE